LVEFEDLLQRTKLTAMNTGPDPSRPVEAVTETWRAQSLNAVLWVTLVLAFPAVLMAMLQWPASFSPPMRIFAIVLYLFLVGVAVCHRAKTAWRAWAVFLSMYVLAAIQLHRAGMAGDGRIALVAIPLYALLLAGFRSAWVALVLGVLLYAAFLGLLAWGPLAERMEVQLNPVEPGYWIFQGILLLAAVVPLLVLLQRFRALHVQAVEAESKTLARIRYEIVNRNAAYGALEQAARDRRRLEDQITRASELERRRLGSELHDGLCQQLTAALLQCVAIENRQSAEPPQAASAVRTLRGLLEDSIGVAYEVARGLCPLDVGADSLGSALERLAQRTREATGLECEFRDEGDSSIGDQQTALHLYRIAQEAVANAARHARPRRIVIRLGGAADSLLLQVEDDGCGMPATADRSDVMGMNIMAYRAASLGGQLDVERRPSGGTRIVCRVPRRVVGNGGPRQDDGLQNGLRPFPVPQEDDSHGR